MRRKVWPTVRSIITNCLATSALSATVSSMEMVIHDCGAFSFACCIVVDFEAVKISVSHADVWECRLTVLSPIPQPIVG